MTPPWPQDFGLDPSRLALVRAVLKHCGADRRVMDLFSDRSLGSRFASLAKQHLAGVENVYTQHTPPLVGLLERVVRGRLPEADYPRVDRDASPTGPAKVGEGLWGAGLRLWRRGLGAPRCRGPCNSVGSTTSPQRRWAPAAG